MRPVRGTRTCAALLRGAPPRGAERRVQAECRERRRHCRRRRSIPRIARRAERRVASRRAARAAHPSRREATSARVSRVPPRARCHSGRTTTYRFGSVPSLSVCTPATSCSRSCTTFRSTARHRLEQHPLTGQRAIRSADRDPLERRAAAIAIAGGVHRHRLPSRRARCTSGVGDVLQRIDRLAVLADQQPGIPAGARDRDLVVRLAHVDAGACADRSDDVLDQ